MTNGCGCQTGLLKYFKPPYAKKFYVPCCIHDDDYELAIGTRKDADRRLFKNCLKVIWATKGEGPVHLTWMTFIALLYYLAVRVFEGFYWGRRG